MGREDKGWKDAEVTSPSSGMYLSSQEEDLLNQLSKATSALLPAK